MCFIFIPLSTLFLLLAIVNFLVGYIAEYFEYTSGSLTTLSAQNVPTVRVGDENGAVSACHLHAPMPNVKVKVKVKSSLAFVDMCLDLTAAC